MNRYYLLIATLFILLATNLFSQIGANKETKMMIAELEKFANFNAKRSLKDVITDYESQNSGKKLDIKEMFTGKDLLWWDEYFQMTARIDSLLNIPEISTRIQPSNQKYKDLSNTYNTVTQFLHLYVAAKEKQQEQIAQANRAENAYNSINDGDILCWQKGDSHGGSLTIKVVVVEKSRSSIRVKTISIYDDDPWNHFTGYRDTKQMADLVFTKNKSTYISLSQAATFFKCR